MRTPCQRSFAAGRPAVAWGDCSRGLARPAAPRRRLARPCRAETGAERYGWTLREERRARPGVDGVEELPLSVIRRPLERTRSNDGDKVAALMESIREVGQQEPVDVLLVDGQYYGFSGCHRFEAIRNLGQPTILAKIRKGNRTTLKMHMM